MLYGYGSIILDGALVTIEQALLSVALSFLLGLVGAAAKSSQSKSAKLLSGIYTTLIRGVPDLVLMLLIFYGLLCEDLAAAPTNPNRKESATESRASSIVTSAPSKIMEPYPYSITIYLIYFETEKQRGSSFEEPRHLTTINVKRYSPYMLNLKYFLAKVS
jgi:His/Glu/Gln/Arg/opine family amino acid ABC transporter permease subunit